MKIRSRGGLSKIVGALFFFFFFVMMPPFSFLELEMHFEYLGYPPSFSRIIDKQIPLTQQFFLDHAYDVNLEYLYQKIAADELIRDNDILLLQSVQNTYPDQPLQILHAEFFFHLAEISEWEGFFAYKVDLGLINHIELNSNMLQISKEPVYLVNSPYVPVLMYHMLDSQKYWIDQASFMWQLEQLAKANFSTIRADALMKGDFSDIPEGRKPILLTFDDGNESQFRLLENAGPDPSTGVGMLETIYQQFPEFGKNAVFYIYFSRIPFGEVLRPSRWKEKIAYLQSNGYEIGNHTYDHQIMTHFSPGKIVDNLDKFYHVLEQIPFCDISQVMTLAYPGGGIPIHRSIIESYQYQGYSLSGGFGAWGGKTLIPIHPSADRYHLPRYDASNDQVAQISQDPHFFIKTTQTVEVPQFIASSSFLMEKFLRQYKDLHATEIIWQNQWISFQEICNLVEEK